MKELLNYILRSIVDNADDILIDEKVQEDGYVVLTVHVNQADMGKVIGKDGKIIKAIRTLVRVVAIREGKKVSVELEDQSAPETSSEQTPEVVVAE
ncbi:MAG: KH domain-containing protein [bacterium]|nr:KH domain-containing protein [bacterium]